MRLFKNITVLAFVIGLAAWARADGPPADIAWPTEVPGYGPTPEQARQNARKAACETVVEFLREQKPPLLEWRPDDAYMEKHIFEGPGSEGGKMKIGDNEFKSWSVRLKPPNMKEFVRLNDVAMRTRQDKERQEIALERMTIAGWVLGGTLVLLVGGVACGRIRSGPRPPLTA